MDQRALQKKNSANGENLARWYVTKFKEIINKYINNELSMIEIVIKCINDIKIEFKRIYSQEIDKVDLPSDSVRII